jgi:hypothetical protein
MRQCAAVLSVPNVVPVEIERLHGDAPHRMQPETRRTAIFVDHRRLCYHFASMPITQ